MSPSLILLKVSVNFSTVCLNIWWSTFSISSRFGKIWVKCSDKFDSSNLGFFGIILIVFCFFSSIIFVMGLAYLSINFRICGFGISGVIKLVSDGPTGSDGK